jgi:septal ring factor EnvC (AmiA/AmiB activator)
MEPIVALAVAIIGYIGWAGSVARLKSKRHEISQLQDQVAQTSKIIKVLTDQDKTSEVSRYVLKSHLRQAQHLNEHLRRQVADQQRQIAKLENDGNAARDKLARLKPKRTSNQPG